MAMKDGIYRLVIVSACVYFLRVFVCTLGNPYLPFATMSCTELLGLFWTLSIVLYVEDKEYNNVSETGSFSVLRWMGQ
jgi:hypothetical protein